MKEYKLDRKWPLLCWGSVLLLFLSALAAYADLEALGMIGLVLGAAGAIAAVLCVRCPACGKSLDRLGLQLSREPFFCPHCGAKINRK